MRGTANRLCASASPGISTTGSSAGSPRCLRARAHAGADRPAASRHRPSAQCVVAALPHRAHPAPAGSRRQSCCHHSRGSPRPRGRARRVLATSIMLRRNPSTVSMASRLMARMRSRSRSSRSRTRLLNDPHLVGLARQFRIQAVNDLLIVNQLIADRGNCRLGGHRQLNLNRATWTCAPTARDRYLPRAA